MPRHLDFEFGTVELHTPELALDPAGGNEVIDGDTIKIGGQLFRLRGWDAPPLKSFCCNEEGEKGRQARDHLARCIREAAGQGTLRFEVRNKRDRHRRLLVDIWIGDRDVGELLEEQGLAAPYQGRGPKPLFCNCEPKRRQREAELQIAVARQQRAFEAKQARAGRSGRGHASDERTD